IEESSKLAHRLQDSKQPMILSASCVSSEPSLVETK
ncbi:hypothetical protein SS7213T_03065, partial [Staphylococcus simiae CCM 7213 = CCUG 51256]